MKLYCPVCKKEVDVIIKKRFITYEENNNSFKYVEKYALCPNCKEELYSDELQHENQNEFEKEYSIQNDIITKEEINEILDKYSISKRNLPYVIGIGEITITRYLEGYVPTQKISKLLKSINNDPSLYKRYLEENKDKLKRTVYVKSLNKVDSILGLGNFDEKLEETAEYIIIHNPETTNLVLLKLLYFYDVFYRLFFNKKVFNSQVKAWEHGPVYGRIYYEYKHFENSSIEIEKKQIELNPLEKELLDKIISLFGLYSGKVLSYFTHRDGPWFDAKNNGEEIISSDKIDEFAMKLKEEYNIKTIDDIRNYSEAMFEKYKKEFLD